MIGNHLVGLFLIIPMVVIAEPLDQRSAALLSMQCAPEVHPQTLLSIMQTESGLHAYALHLNGQPGKSTFAKSKEDAIVLASTYLRNKQSFDAGLMQINSANFKRVGLSVSDLFDPCKNIQAGATILSQDYQNALANKLDDPLKGAISSYNTGHFSKGVRNGYYQKVSDNAEKKFTVPALHPTVNQQEINQTEPEPKNVTPLDVFQPVTDRDIKSEDAIQIFD